MAILFVTLLPTLVKVTSEAKINAICQKIHHKQPSSNINHTLYAGFAIHVFLSNEKSKLLSHAREKHVGIV